jgi:hypothetical protein
MNIIFDAIQWLNPIVHALGLGISVWAYRKSRKNGYIVTAAYFALAVFSLVIMPSVNRTISAHRKPDVSMETEMKLRAAIRETNDKVLAESGHPVMAARQNIYFPFGPILLVAGLWLIAKKEKEAPNQQIQAIAADRGSA